MHAAVGATVSALGASTLGGSLLLVVVTGLVSGGLVNAVVEIRRARLAKRLAPAQTDSTIAAGARDAVTALREALAQDQQRIATLDAQLATTRTDLTNCLTDLRDTKEELRATKAELRETRADLRDARARLAALEAGSS